MGRRQFGAWGAAGLALSLMVACAAGNSTSVVSGDGGSDGTIATDGAGGGDGHVHSDGSAGHKDGGHDSATGKPDASEHHDGDVDAATCIAPQVKCPSGCASTSEDPKNCGSCGHVCATGLVCSSGACSKSCAAGQVECTGADGGAVTAPDAGGAPDAHGGTDATVTTDAALADAALVDAAVDSGGGTNPAGSYCTDPSTDRLNCGGCNIVCAYGPHSTPVCTAGACSITCEAGYADCDGKASNGCEVDTANNTSACGACGVVCAAVNGTANCVAGECGIASCNAGFANCDGNVRNGCETNTDNVNNCGSCGNVCNVPNGTAGCPAGTCTVQACNSGFGDCDNNPTNGCETNTTSTVADCGGCGSVCATAHATPACTNSKCTIGSCNAGYTDCDGNPANGCEVNTSTSPSNCGGCGTVCALPEATSGCLNGMCTVAACTPGFADCNGNPADGCEVNVDTSKTNCGSCGNVCNLPNATAGCTGGSCSIASCNAGYADCDGNPANGCEVNIETDPANCGKCGTACSLPEVASSGCSAAACTVLSCASGFANCDGNAANGCEVNTTSDNNNCGGCGKSCLAICGGAADDVAATTCSSIGCTITACESGYSNFDGTCADGCECKNSTTQTNCANATALAAGALTVGQSTTPIVSTMAPPSSVPDAYFTVTFSGNTNTSYHPKITLTGSSEFVMDVTSSCTGALLSACADDGTGPQGVTTWEDSYTAGDPTSYAVTGSHFLPIAAVSATGQVYIRVYRKTGATPTCGTYTLTASE